MSPFEALYGKKFNTLVSWDNLVDRVVLGIELVKDMENQMLKKHRTIKVS